MSQPPTEETKLNPVAILDRVLGFIDAPWKAVVVVVLLIVVGGGYMIYQERARIADAVLIKVREGARFDDVTFINDAPRLLRDVHADLVMLVSINLTDNLLQDRLGITADGNRWVPSPAPQQALSAGSSMPILVRFLEKEVVCSDTSNFYNEDGHVMYQAGYVRVCLVSVPPILGVQVGGLIVAWKLALQPASEARAAVVIKAAALRYAVW